MPTNVSESIVHGCEELVRRVEFMRQFRRIAQYDLSLRLPPFTNSPFNELDGVTEVKALFQAGDYVERRPEYLDEVWTYQKPPGKGPFKVVYVFGTSFHLQGQPFPFLALKFRKVKGSRSLSGFGKFSKSLKERGL